MKLIIAGGRTYQMTLDDWVWLDWLNEEIKITKVISGGALGADRGGEIWATKRGIPLVVNYAEWEKLGKKAGPIRNQTMIDWADGLAVFPGGAGTADVVRKARRKGIPVYYATKARG